MKYREWVLILVILLFIFGCQKQETAEQTGIETEKTAEEIPPIDEKVAANLDLAMESIAKGQVSDGASLLLDSVLLVKPDDQWPEGFVKHITEAKENFVSENISDGLGNVSAALNLLKRPEGTEQSEESGEIAPIAALIINKIEEIKEMFKKGEGDQGVISILETLQLFGPKTN
jgi:hypothetical protein